MLTIQYPPTMIITKGPDGKVTYRGLAFDILDYFAKSLDIR